MAVNTEADDITGCSDDHWPANGMFSWFSKSRLVLTFLVLPFWYLLTPGGPGHIPEEQ